MLLFNAVFTIEPLHATGRIDQALRARVERMAFGADFDADIGCRRARLEGIAASASDHTVAIFRMDSSFHRTLSVG